MLSAAVPLVRGNPAYAGTDDGCLVIANQNLTEFNKGEPRQGWIGNNFPTFHRSPGHGNVKAKSIKKPG